MWMTKEQLRQAQLVQLEIAKEVKRVCFKNNLQFFLDSGTLLGAVRHGGFIPWDDDLDLGMFREDYEKFLELAEKELSSKYELVTWKTDKEYGHQFCKVMKRGTVYIEEKAINSKSKHGIYIDIFPYDNFPDDIKDQKIQGRKYTIYRALIRTKSHYHTWIYHGKIDLLKFLKWVGALVVGIFFSKKNLIIKYENAVMKFNDVSCKKCFSQGTMKYGKWCVDINAFDSYIDIKFEDTIFPAPKGFDTYLKSVYGDYMKLPPKEQQEGRHSIIKLSFGDM